MIYTCIACHYTFDTDDYKISDLPDRCPDCGKRMLENRLPAIRVATEQEVQEYNQYRKEFA